MIIHSPRRLTEPYPRGWILYLSETPPKRLLVFVHGFRGRAVHSWQNFAASAPIGPWWCESDMLFVGYDSVRDNVTAVASRLRRCLPMFAPSMPEALLTADGNSLRDGGVRYAELYLIGHSLGGLVIRRALADTAQDWIDQRRSGQLDRRPILLDAHVRLFSPAIAGFRAAGRLGVARATPFWMAVDMYLRKSSAFTELQPGSPLLVETRKRTERLVNEHRDDLGVLRAPIVWANPDNVVLTERYDTDPVDDAIDDTDHSTVCKPSAEHPAPWLFVETGRPR